MREKISSTLALLLSLKIGRTSVVANCFLSRVVSPGLQRGQNSLRYQSAHMWCKRDSGVISGPYIPPYLAIHVKHNITHPPPRAPESCTAPIKLLLLHCESQRKEETCVTASTIFPIPSVILTNTPPSFICCSCRVQGIHHNG